MAVDPREERTTEDTEDAEDAEEEERNEPSLFKIERNWRAGRVDRRRMKHRDAEDIQGGQKKGAGAERDGLTAGGIGAAIEVHRVLGPGLLEAVYEEAMCVELGLREIAFRRQMAVGVHYKGRLVGEGRLDLLVADRLVVELKAVERLAPIHIAQTLSYLKAAKLQHGLLITFNVLSLRLGIKRVIQSR